MLFVSCLYYIIPYLPLTYFPPIPSSLQLFSSYRLYHLPCMMNLDLSTRAILDEVLFGVMGEPPATSGEENEEGDDNQETISTRRVSRGRMEQGQRPLSVLTRALRDAAENAMTAPDNNSYLPRDTHAVSSSSSSSSSSSFQPPPDMIPYEDIHHQHCTKFHHTVLTSIYHDNIRLGVAYIAVEVSNTPCQYTLSNSRNQYTLSIHSVNTPCQYTLSTPCQYTLSTQPINTLCQHVPSIHSVNTSHQYHLTALSIYLTTPLTHPIKISFPPFSADCHQPPLHQSTLPLGTPLCMGGSTAPHQIRSGHQNRSKLQGIGHILPGEGKRVGR